MKIKKENTDISSVTATSHCLLKKYYLCDDGEIYALEIDWISLKDENPPMDGTPFLCYDPSKNHSERIYIEKRDGEYFTGKPTHWMPLPVSPKE